MLTPVVRCSHCSGKILCDTTGRDSLASLLRIYFLIYSIMMGREETVACLRYDAVSFALFAKYIGVRCLVVGKDCK
jgi:hypothetical protein